MATRCGIGSSDFGNVTPLDDGRDVGHIFKVWTGYVYREVVRVMMQVKFGRLVCLRGLVVS